jgi:hypothetical protein
MSDTEPVRPDVEETQEEAPDAPSNPPAEEQDFAYDIPASDDAEGDADQ